VGPSIVEDRTSFLLLAAHPEELLAKADYRVGDLIEASNPAPFLSEFAAVIPNYRELELKITDPSQFAVQYRDEMIHLLGNLQAKVAKKADRERQPAKPAVADSISSAFLNAYVENIQPRRTL
jgi:hypothetical protein